MAPKKSNKKSAADDEFELLIAAAQKAAETEKKSKKEKDAKKVKAAVPEVETPVDVVPKVVSTADHPENPYPKTGKVRQTWPEPGVTVFKQFGPKNFPVGVVTPHPGDSNTFRVTSEEKRSLERAGEQQIQDLRHAAEVHRQVRTWAMSWIKPGMPLITITDRIEKKLEELIGKDGLKRGQAFPTGCSINHVAAHYTPNSMDTKVVLEYDDVMKLDFGTQVNGHIIDSAWTVTPNEERYRPLVQACKASTNEGLKHAGIDARLDEIGARCQEVMESHEIELNGKTIPIKSIRNLCGHNIGLYQIHSGKSVPIVGGGHSADRMEEGELYAIETFGSTGKAIVQEDGECSHYMICDGQENAIPRTDKAAALFKHIKQNFGTLAFCRKWLDRQGQDRHIIALNGLCDAGIIGRHPPLVDSKGSYTAQSEHTFILKPTAKEILSRGDDY